MCQRKPLKSKAQSSSLCLQMLLHFNVYCSMGWALIYGYHIACNLTTLWTFEGSFVLLAFLVALAIEFGRVYCGMSANLRMQSALLIVFLTLTPFIMLPILLFLRFAATTQITLITYGTGILFVFMALEFPAGIYTYIKFYREETQPLQQRQNTTQLQLQKERIFKHKSTRNEPKWQSFIAKDTSYQ